MLTFDAQIIRRRRTHDPPPPLRTLKRSSNKNHDQFSTHYEREKTRPSRRQTTVMQVHPSTHPLIRPYTHTHTQADIMPGALLSIGLDA